MPKSRGINKEHTVNCVVCGTVFTAYRYNAKFCSQACKKRDYRQNLAAQHAADRADAEAFHLTAQLLEAWDDTLNARGIPMSTTLTPTLRDLIDFARSESARLVKQQ